KKLQTTNLLSSPSAGSLVQTMLMGGPRLPGQTADSTSKQPAPSRSWPTVLDQSAYVDLLSTVVDAALKATPGQNNQRGARIVRPNQGGGVQPLTDAQTEQNNARRLLGGLMSVLPAIDQYLPAKASQVRQKMAEIGMQPNPVMAQLYNGQNEPTTD